jgi:hypothetical protein
VRCVMSAGLTRRATDHPSGLDDRDSVARLGLSAELARGIPWDDASRLLNLSDVTRFRRKLTTGAVSAGQLHRVRREQLRVTDLATAREGIE